MGTTSGNIGKYFLHGFIFSLLMTIVTIGWAFIFAVLVIFGLIIGLIIGFALIFLFYGAINSFLAGEIWDLNMKSAWSDYIVHGFVLFILLAVVAFPLNLIIESIAPAYDPVSLITRAIILMIITAFIDGYIAKAVADSFKL